MNQRTQLCTEELDAYKLVRACGFASLCTRTSSFLESLIYEKCVVLDYYTILAFEVFSWNGAIFRFTVYSYTRSEPSNWRTTSVGLLGAGRVSLDIPTEDTVR